MSRRTVFFSGRRWRMLAFLLGGIPLMGLADPEPCITGISVKDGDLYLSTSFAQPFVLEKGNADGNWTRVGLFSEAVAGSNDWFRAVQLEEGAVCMDDSIGFTPGDQGEEAGETAEGPWTLIRRGGGAGEEEGVYGPLLRQEDPEMGDPPTAGGSLGNAVVFWSSTAGKTAAWTLDGYGVKSGSGSILASSVSSAWTLTTLGDLDGDDIPELFWKSSSGTVNAWFLNSNCQYVRSTNINSSALSRYWRLAGCGDVNGDGRVELFFHNTSSGATRTWFLGSDGALERSVAIYSNGISSGWTLRTCGDVDGDGNVELFWQRSDGDTRTWFLNTNGQWTSSATTSATRVSSAWTLRGSGDVNGDGSVELFWQSSAGATRTWFLDRYGVLERSVAMSTTAVSKAWTMRAAADVDGDSRDEILWQSSAGATATWFLNTNGQKTSSRAMSSAAVSTAYTIRGAYVGPMTVGSSGWTEVAGFPHGIYAGGAAVLGSYLYHVGGYQDVTVGTNVYRYNGTSWSEVRGLPKSIAQQSVCLYSNYLYSIGGYSDYGTPSAITNVYRFNGTNWTEVAGLPAARFSGAAAVLGNSIYYLGGYISGGAYTNVYRYNGTTWTEVAGLPASRSFFAAATLGGALYVAGGYDSTNHASTNVFCFNGTAWTEVAGLPNPRTGHTLTALNGALYAVGGNDSSAYTNVYRFNGTAWTEVAGLPKAVHLHSAAAFGGRLVVMGGTVFYNSSTNVYRYTP